MPSDHSSAPTPPVTATPNPHRWHALGILASAVSLIVIDGTIVNVALPTMMRALPLSFTQAQWVTTLYSLIFAALLISTGRLGDRIGRRITLIIGLATFTADSLLAAAATSAGILLLARAIQGVGGAFVLPSTLSIVNATFRGRERAAAFGVWGATISGAAAIGPLLGGWLTTNYSWRWVFLINVPLAALILAGALAWVRESTGRHTPQPAGRIADGGASPSGVSNPGKRAGFDALGFLLSTVGMGALVFGLIEGRSLGWWEPLAGTWASAWPLSPAPAALMLGAAATAAFTAWEGRRAADGGEVLLDVRLFRLPSFAWGNVAALVVAMGEFGLLFVLPLYLQNVRGASPIEAGWILAAMAAGAFLSGGAAAPLAKRTTPADVATAGLILETLGVAALALLLRADSPLWHVLVPLVVYGLGLGMASAQLTGTILVDVPPAQSGQGSATQSTVRQLGSALGTAVIASIMAAATPSGPGGMIAQFTTDSARPSLWAGAAFLLIGAIATTRLPRHRPEAGRDHRG